MRHGKHTFKLGRNSGHRRSLVANMLKALVEQERIVTTVGKAKELRRHADWLITLAKDNSLAHRRLAIARLMTGEKSELIDKLFTKLAPRFAERAGGYTRLIRLGLRTGDAAPTCILEYLP